MIRARGEGCRYNTVMGLRSFPSTFYSKVGIVGSEDALGLELGRELILMGRRGGGGVTGVVRRGGGGVTGVVRRGGGGVEGRELDSGVKINSRSAGGKVVLAGELFLSGVSRTGGILAVSVSEVR